MTGITNDEQENIDTVRSYLSAVADGAVGDRLAAFFTKDAQQIELPNRLNPKGGQSDLSMMLQRAEQGQRLLSAQTYDVRSVVARGEHVAVEAEWTGTLAVAFGTLAPGFVMKANFAMFFEFSNGRIRRQRNYDCFEAW
jgi:ketosteroid isomerase-like protein